MKKYKVIKTYIILAEDDIHLHAILRTGEMNPIERYRSSQDIIRLARRAKKKGWQLWILAFAKQLRYLVFGR